MELVVATKNQNKIKEMASIFVSVFPPELMLLDLSMTRDDFSWPDVIEDRLTFEGNAIKKAVELARHAGQTVLAEDSGLVVDALDGAPGVFSARYAGPQRSDADNNARLVQALTSSNHTAPYTARYVAVVALAMFEHDPLGAWLLERLRARHPAIEERGEPTRSGQLGELDGALGDTPRCHVIWWRGECEGEICLDARGTGGFGYDPHFFLPELGKAMAELSILEKGEISHRRRALEAMSSALNP